jgi:uncharacterized protein YijF (DUF1287 family)
MGLINPLINSLVHFIAIKMNAFYADQAGNAKTAVNSTYAQVSKEAERLNLGGTMIYIDPTNRYLIFTTPDMDINQSIMIDVVNRNILNVNSITDVNGNVICPVQTSGSTF